LLTRFATGNALKRMCGEFAGSGQIPDLLIGQRIRIHSPLTIRHLEAIHIVCCKVSFTSRLNLSPKNECLSMRCTHRLTMAEDLTGRGYRRNFWSIVK